MIRHCLSIPQKTYQITKRLKLREVEQYFPGFLAFIDCTEQQIPRPVDRERERCSTQVRRKDILLLRIRLRLTIVVISFTK